MSQIADRVLMIEPAGFTTNSETMQDNSFQHSAKNKDEREIQRKALEEFDSYRRLLERNGISVKLFKDSVDNRTPDSIFPNNWFSTHARNTFVIYPLKCEVRRRERRVDIIDYLKANYPNVIDMTEAEQAGHMLEGTGSLVLDRSNKVAFACLSQRTDEILAREWARKLSYELYLFRGQDREGNEIYHTNCMLGVATGFVVVCWDAVRSGKERAQLAELFQKTGHEIIAIDFAQMESFCANLLGLCSRDGELITAMSTKAYQAFGAEQLAIIERSSRIIHTSLETIEWYGGGGARCMLAELF